MHIKYLYSSGCTWLLLVGTLYWGLSCLAPNYIQELNSKEAGKYALHSDSGGLLLNPVKYKTLTTLGDHPFTVAAPEVWNLLPLAIRSSPSYQF